MYINFKLTVGYPCLFHHYFHDDAHLPQQVQIRTLRDRLHPAFLLITSCHYCSKGLKLQTKKVYDHFIIITDKNIKIITTMNNIL